MGKSRDRGGGQQSQPPGNDQGLLSPKEVCQLLGISTRTLRKWVAIGILPEPIRFNKRVLRWKRSSLKRWLDRPAQ